LLRVQGVRPGWQPLVDHLHGAPAAHAGTLLAAVFFVVTTYHTGLVAALSGTLGHRLLGLRVRQNDGNKPGPFRALLRGLGCAVGVMMFAVGPAYGVLLDRRGRGVGDLLARSFVAVADRPSA
jgi:uncharacterized RDD family membrane protein YckC